MKMPDYLRLAEDLKELRLDADATEQALGLLHPGTVQSPLDFPPVLAQVASSTFTLSHEQQQLLALGTIFDRKVSTAVDLHAGGVVQYLTPHLRQGMTLAYHTAYDRVTVVVHADPATGWT